MVDVYFHIPEYELENVAECGLKLSKWASRQITIEGFEQNCLMTYLNPRDSSYYGCDGYECLRMEIDEKHCFVADGSLYGIDNDKELYYKSIMPVKNYIFGNYRHPECLITTTVLPGNVHVFGKSLQSPLLFENSEGFYVSSLIEKLEEETSDFKDRMLYAYFESMYKKGVCQKVENKKANIAVYIMDDKIHTVPMFI